jgi:hypothetical protein
MDNRDQLPHSAPPEELDAAVEGALDTFPLIPTPPGFTARVMAEVWQPRPSFRLEFTDFTLPAFFALFSAGILAVGLYFLSGLDRLTRLQLELQGKILLMQILVLPEQITRIWMPVIVICGVLLMTIMIGVGIWVAQRPVLRMED